MSVDLFIGIFEWNASVSDAYGTTIPTADIKNAFIVLQHLVFITLRSNGNNMVTAWFFNGISVLHAWHYVLSILSYSLMLARSFLHWLRVNRLESIGVKRATNLLVAVWFKCHFTWSAYPFIFCNNKSEMAKTFNARKMFASFLCLSVSIEWHYFADSSNSNCIFKLPFENFNGLGSWNLLGLFCG